MVQDPSTGQQIQVVVPDGIEPGQTFQVQVPFSPPAPVPMGQPYVQQQYAPPPQQYAPQPQQYAPQPQPQPQQYAPQPVAPQQVEMLMQPLSQAPINNNNNNNNKSNTMQMQAPMPQQMDTHEPRMGWQSGLFDCCDDIPVCASHPELQPTQNSSPPPWAHPRPKDCFACHRPPLTSYSAVSSPRCRFRRLVLLPLCLRDARRHALGKQGASGHAG